MPRHIPDLLCPTGCLATHEAAPAIACPPASPPASPHAAPMHDATVLTAGGKVARIHLNGQVYALRITRAGKLILTK